MDKETLCANYRTPAKSMVSNSPFTYPPGTETKLITELPNMYRNRKSFLYYRYRFFT